MDFGGLGRCDGVGSGGDKFACGEVEEDSVEVELLVLCDTCEGGAGAEGGGSGC